MGTLRISALLAFLAAALPAQTFEAASIKLSNGGPGGGINLSTGRIGVRNATLKFCVAAAWNVKDFLVAGGPPWDDKERYNIEAMAAAPFKKGEWRTMLQNLLLERFPLAIHRETQDRMGYHLVAARGGAKLPPPKDDPDIMFSNTPTGDRTLRAQGATLGDLAMALSATLGVTVLDRTGIDGKYDVSLKWTPDPETRPLVSKSGQPLPPPPADTPPGPSIFQALQQTLGLKLEAAKVPVEVIVIDRAEHPTEN